MVGVFICHEHSLVHTTFSKLSWRYCCAQRRCLVMFASQISWQYALLWKVQPKEVRHRRTVHRLILYQRSTTAFTAIIFDGHPDPGSLVIHPVSSNFLMNFAMLTRLALPFLQEMTDRRCPVTLKVMIVLVGDRVSACTRLLSSLLTFRISIFLHTHDHNTHAYNKSN